MNRKLLGIILIVVLALSLCGIALASDVEPAPPTLKLTVEKSLLTIYPPYMIYTAQLSYVPQNNSSSILMANFYNINLDGTVNNPVLLGSAPFDKTGKAVFSKQIGAGAYAAYATTVINGKTIVSNKVEYKVP